MGLDVEVKVFFIYAIVMLAALLFGRILLFPVKILLKLFVNVLIAALAIAVMTHFINYII